MIISNKGIKFIAQWEGKRLTKYKDSAGLWTIGIGHLITGKENPPIGDTITDVMCNELFIRDSRIANTAIDNNVKVPLTQNEFDSILSLVYNIGTGAFSKSTLLKKLNAGDKPGAADEFLKWNKAGGRVIQGLVNRRQSERKLFLTGNYV